MLHADGKLSTCSRIENRELFSLAIGGYGLFGVITRVRLRLMRRTKLERVVRIVDIDDLMPAFAERIGEGYLYGDCQFSTDASSDTYLRKVVFACYRPLSADAPMPAEQKELDEAQWRELYHLSALVIVVCNPILDAIQASAGVLMVTPLPPGMCEVPHTF
jgi:FAD/FMN-containing dehydrogenase